MSVDDHKMMRAPGAQDDVPAREIPPEGYIFIPGGWTQVTRVENGERVVAVIEVEFGPDEMVPICRPIR